MKYYKECHCCGHTETAHMHKINKGLAQALIEFVLKYRDEQTKAPQYRKTVNPNQLPLTHNQKANWQKLRYFGLVYRDDDGRHPTHRAYQWIWHGGLCASRVITMSNEVLPYDHEARDTTKQKPDPVTISDVLGSDEFAKYKQRSDYQREMPTPSDRQVSLF